MPSHPDADALMRAVLDGLHDPVARLVFADWLEETGTPSNTAWARYIRLTHAADPIPPAELTRAAAGIRARLTLHTRFFLNNREAVLAILPPASIRVWLREFHPPRAVADMISVSVVRENRILPLDASGGAFVFAAAEPLDPDLRQRLGWALNSAVILVGAAPGDLKEATHRVYGDWDRMFVDLGLLPMGFGDPRGSGVEILAFTGSPLDVTDGAAPIARLATLIVEEALDQRAAAIQVRPTPEGARATYFIDGTWADRDLIPLRVLRPLADRFRVMGDLDPDGSRGRVEWGLIRFPYRSRHYVFLLEITETAAGPDVLIQLHEPAD